MYEEFNSILRAEIQKLLPRPMDELSLDYQILPGPADSKSQRVLVNAVSRALVAFYTKVFQKVGIRLEALEPESTALGRALVGRDQSISMIVDMGAERTNFFIIDESIPITHHSIEVGVNRISGILKNILQHLKNENIPIVFIPMCNPLGYFRNWRYSNEYRDYQMGTSVGDSEHLLFNEDYHPRRIMPACDEADQLTKAVLKNINPRPPILSMDFHEDEDSRGSNTFSYIYSQGKMGVDDPIAKMVVQILTGNNILLQQNGVTRFGDTIVDGIVNASKDGSIDELLASNVIYKNNSMILKHPAKTVIVVETPSVGVPLEKRVIAHLEIIHHMEMFYHMADGGY